MKNNFFLKQNLKVVKLCGLTVLVFYSIGVVLFNILYYKYQKQENILFPKINFGIDIVGGKQLTIAVDTSGVVDELSNNNNDFLQNFCKEKKVNCKIQNNNGNFLITATRGTAINTKQDNKQFIREIRSYLNNYNVEVLRNDDKELVISSVVSQKGIDGIIADTTDKAISILKNRIDGVGVKEIAIQRYGTDKIVILTDQTGESENGYLYLSKVLGSNNYNVVEMEIEKADIPDDVNTVIISGMGGRNIIGILKYKMNIVKKIDTFILSPNNYQIDVKKFLCKNGYYIDDEVLVKEKKFIYQILVFKKGKKHYTKRDYFFGPVLLQKKGSLFNEYYSRELKSREILLSLLPKNYRYKKFITRKEIKMIKEELNK